MPREVTPQADQHAQSPHVQNVHALEYPGYQDDVVPGSPQDHAQHTYPDFSPYDSGGGTRQWNEGSGYEPTAHEEHMGELAADDDDSGYNWGPPSDPHCDPHMPEHDLDDTEPDPDHFRGY
jgi:hypothetical protein